MSTTPCPTYTAPAKMPVCTMGEQSSSSTIALNANATAETSRNALRTASERLGVAAWSSCTHASL